MSWKTNRTRRAPQRSGGREDEDVMDVAELRKYLSDFPPNTRVQVVIEHRPMPFELGYGTSEGVTKQTAEVVSFHVGGTSERVEPPPAAREDSRDSGDGEGDGA